jgi:hypothetical protein
LELERRGYKMSHWSVVRRLEKVIKNSEHLKNLFNPPRKVKRFDSWDPISETLTDDQRQMMEKFRKISAGEMSINQL